MTQRNALKTFHITMKMPESTLGEYGACSLIGENSKHFESSFEIQWWQLWIIRLDGSPKGIFLGMIFRSMLPFWEQIWVVNWLCCPEGWSSTVESQIGYLWTLQWFRMWHKCYKYSILTIYWLLRHSLRHFLDKWLNNPSTILIKELSLFKNSLLASDPK